MYYFNIMPIKLNTDQVYQPFTPPITLFPCSFDNHRYSYLQIKNKTKYIMQNQIHKIIITLKRI